jgi:glycosyltransferase involved in cell wall biosynthesis
MRVTLDARTVGFPGIGRFIMGLWGGLRASRQDVVGLWPSKELRQWLGDEHAGPAGPHELVRARAFLPAEQVAVPLALRRLRTDVHHATHINVPYAARVPVVLTVHDLMAYLDRGVARSRTARAYYRGVFPRAVRRATIVVAVSPFTARQLVDTFGLTPDRLRIVEHGLDHTRWRPRPAAEIAGGRARFGLPERYLLYVGTAKPHKNLATLLAAHRPRHAPLVLVGPTRAELTAAGLEPPGGGRVIVLGRVPDDALPALYAGARALVLPSLHEGVGFPPLEAMACGTPAVVSDRGALPETVGDAGVVVPALDTDAWDEALARIDEDEPVRAELIDRGKRWTADRDWAAAARRYADVYALAASA